MDLWKRMDQLIEGGIVPSLYVMCASALLVVLLLWHMFKRPRSADSEEDFKEDSSDEFPEEDEDDDVQESNEDVDADDQENSICGSCGGSYAPSEFWIMCDFCKKWFHGECVKVTPARADHMKVFKCPFCIHNRPRGILIER